jgi:hypothetical protein
MREALKRPESKAWGERFHVSQPAQNSFGFQCFRSILLSRSVLGLHGGFHLSASRPSRVSGEIGVQLRLIGEYQHSKGGLTNHNIVYMIELRISTTSGESSRIQSRCRGNKLR